MRMLTFLRKALHPDRGQMTILFAAVFTITMVAGVISVDLGLWLSERRSAVKAADLAALAGSQDLPASVTDARQAALDWAERNGWKNDPDNKETVTVEFFCSNTLESVPGLCHKHSASNPDPERCPLTGEADDDDYCDSLRVTVRKPGTHIFSSFFGMGAINEGSAATAALSFDVVPRDVVLVIDRSGSMGAPPLSAGQLRIYWAKLAANNFVDQLAGPDGDLSPYRVAVISFAGSSTATINIALNAGTTASAVHSAINSIAAPPGSTYIAPALKTATDQLNTLGRAGAEKIVILLSDGRNWTNPGETPDVATRRANTVKAVGPLHAAADMVSSIGIGTEGTGPSELDVKLLQQIAKPSANYIHVAEAADLPYIFRDLAWKIAGRALTQ